MARDQLDSVSRRKAHTLFLRLCLPPYTIHFKSPTYMKQHTLEMLDQKICKQTLKSTASTPSVRETIGTDPKFWTDLVTLFKAAIPSLERRSFTIWDPTSVDYESTSGALIASHYPGLWKDLERLNDLVSISRNVLTIGSLAQDLAAESGIDHEIFRMLNCAVRVTARGYDGDAGTGEEEKWQWVVNGYKKLLITSLQFLNNFVAQNERRKLMLWVSLFDSSNESVLAHDGTIEDAGLKDDFLPHPELPVVHQDLLIAYGSNGEETLNLDEAVPLYDDTPFTCYPREMLDLKDRSGTLLDDRGSGYVLFGKQTLQFTIDDFHTVHNRDPTLAECHFDLVRKWAELEPADHDFWQKKYEEAKARYLEDIAAYNAEIKACHAQGRSHPALPAPRASGGYGTSGVPVPEQIRNAERKIAELERQVAEKYGTRPPPVEPLQPPLYDASNAAEAANSSSTTTQAMWKQPIQESDLRMLFTAEAGAKILESGKAELMKRLEGYEPSPEEKMSEAVAKVRVSHNLDDFAPFEPGPLVQLGTYPDGKPIMGLSDEDQIKSEARLREYRRQERLHDARWPAVSHAPPPRPASQQALPGVAPKSALLDSEAFAEDSQDEELDEEEESEGDEEVEEEEEYPGSTEDGRGLLTDVPLILGPSEIEVLPMIVMSGIVAPPHQLAECKTAEERNALVNMHTVRCHLLLAQDNGRNLLRELLIFVAAWDLREEELYFKFMVKIMEAILQNGLMPYAYHAFRDRSRSKDIISPAQAVIMKLLTNIFRARSEASKAAAAVEASNSKELVKHATAAPSMPARVDLHILSFIFTEFRQHIIPQTCALIFLQGQIHKGRASPEDFPLNLWDMERMYEGVYQYLEFFAVLTEEQPTPSSSGTGTNAAAGDKLAWKNVLAGWEIVSELVTLLRELEGGIPKMPQLGQVVHGQGAHGLVRRVSAPAASQRAHSVDTMGMGAPGPPVGGSNSHPQPLASQGTGAAPVAVERPFDVDEDPTLPPLPVSVGTVPTQNQQIFEAETPLAYPEDAQDEPSDFEWRNLKKLTVLVLSSLIWKNKLVQDQVREYGGLEALVGCCRHDEHNPYIREHAIMCLRFAVEGNEENAEVIKKMAGLKQLEGGSVTLGAIEDVPREVLDTNGYETFMDGKGQVGLRRKGAQSSGPTTYTNPKDTYPHPGAYVPTSSGVVAGPSGVAKPRLSATKMTAEKAAELMQSALRDLPLGDKLVTDRQKAEALAKLDRAFETTEKALNSGRGGGGKR